MAIVEGKYVPEKAIVVQVRTVKFTTELCLEKDQEYTLDDIREIAFDHIQAACGDSTSNAKLEFVSIDDEKIDLVDAMTREEFLEDERWQYADICYDRMRGT